MNKQFRKSSIAALVSASFLAPISSISIAEESSGFSLEEVVVTARKREEGLQNAPISITAATGEMLELRQIKTGENLGQVTPNLDFSSQSPSSGNNASSQVFLRGVGQTDFLPTTDPGVGIYTDGVYLARSTGGNFDFLDIERVEVLRGPQGTLFGRNTIGGAIDFKSKAPTEDFEGKLKLTIGEDSLAEAVATLNVPFSDDFRGRFNVLRKTRDGYVTRLSDGEDLGDDNGISARAYLVWEPSDTAKISLIADYHDSDENGSPMVFNTIGTSPANAFATFASQTAGCPGVVSLGPPAGRTGTPENNDPRCANNQWDAGPFATNGTFPTASEHEEFGLNLTTEWQLDNVEIKTITAYRDSDSFSSTDADNTPLDVFDRVNTDFQEQFSQEIQFKGTAFNDSVNWIVGLYYFEEEAEDVNIVRFAGAGFGDGGLGIESIGGLVENDTQAAYGQATWDATDQLSITAGLRYTEETKSFTPNVRVLGDIASGGGRYFAETGCLLVPVDRSNFPTSGSGLSLITIAGGCPTSESQLVKQTFDIDEVTPMLNAAYQWTDNVMTYATYSEGFKSGGFGARVVAPVTGAKPYDPEFVETIELGLKSTLFDDKLRFNAALFTTDYSDMQIVIRQDFNPVPFNAGEAGIDGAEFEITFIPNSSWQINAGLGLLDASYDSLSAEVLAAGITVDSDLPHVPEVTANIGIAYYAETSWGSISPRIDWSYRDELFFDANNSEVIAADSHSVVNLAVNFTNSDGTWEATLGLNNATDEIYRVAGNQALGGAASYVESTYARPRNWFLSATYNF